MTSRIPHLLEPYLALPDEASLIVLTGVLGASTNWLVLRHLYALLKQAGTAKPPQPGVTVTGASPAAAAGQEEEAAVLLVSFLRDLAFWRDGLARLGVDLEAAARRGRFAYVDGLGGGLGGGGSLKSGEATGGGGGGGGGGSTQAIRPHHQSQSQHQSRQQQQQQQQQRAGVAGWKRVPASLAPGDIARVVLEGVAQLKKGGSAGTGLGDREGRERKVVLVIDGLDFVLAASPPPSSAGGEPSGIATAVWEMLMDLRENTHAAIVTVAADDPLIKEQQTSLEKQHAWFALSLVHEADAVLSLRLLDTGVAKDVSGVIRITHGGGRLLARDQEYLYHVGGDGGVKVFERGQ
ncbi:uncharacterized protein THITE_2111529 [Thermothielavioides terrestris NRRL 8126]|uniref:Elongator complex protein 6 n=1 Tax=Thermothielavioides terrestris (strain ATCC 38088 / NRRL 8126) TaxID=578455 RepID=G2R2R0_THETT|nr:uncharacterized protein THITE_2111529 [Thermothielavioides terrestris NRRL 8126]AEO65021.1 hypothetical protein THITE_2111529 [Thermothielavioides terrestris NRRL 8126]